MDLFEAQVQTEVERRVDAEIQRRLDDPRTIIAAYQKRVAELENEAEALQPKAEFYDTVASSDDWMEMSAAVKTLGFRGYGRNKTFQLLRDRQILRYNNEPYQSYVERGYFKVIEQHFNNPQTDEVMINRKTVVSQKGLDFIRKVITEGLE
ncbi:MAG: phage antirepressor KilAC domain-containing protein [Spirochaetota bacterium]|jgi:phage antirepressor YoqD-like protein|nr:phage antirepressor KilAC domain-containing protein [Spirochaetota bacterium]